MQEGGHNYLMDRDVAEIGGGVGGVDGVDVLDAGGEQLPGVVAFLPPGVGRHGVGDGGADVRQVVVDPLLAVGEGDLRG